MCACSTIRTFKTPRGRTKLDSLLSALGDVIAALGEKERRAVINISLTEIPRAADVILIRALLVFVKFS